MNWKSYVPIGAACVLGLIAAKIGWNLMSPHPAPVSAPVPSNTLRVVVANKDIAAGSELHAADLTLDDLPQKAATGQTYASVNDLVNRVAAVALVKGQAIVESMLLSREMLSGLSAVIPPGMRAITIDVNETTGVAGMIQPGCHVDLVMTLIADANGPAIARTIADNVEILAIGRRYGHQNNQASSIDTLLSDAGNPRNVTLLVTPQQAHTVELAFKMGNPRFVLRSGLDTKATPNAGMTLAALRTQSPEENIQDTMFARGHTSGAGPTTRPGEDVWSVRVIRATAESTVNLPLDSQRQKEQPVIVRPQTPSSSGMVENETAPAAGH